MASAAIQREVVRVALEHLVDGDGVPLVGERLEAQTRKDGARMIVSSVFATDQWVHRLDEQQRRVVALTMWWPRLRWLTLLPRTADLAATPPFSTNWALWLLPSDPSNEADPVGWWALGRDPGTGDFWAHASAPASPHLVGLTELLRTGLERVLGQAIRPCPGVQWPVEFPSWARRLESLAAWLDASLGTYGDLLALEHPLSLPLLALAASTRLAARRAAREGPSSLPSNWLEAEVLMPELSRRSLLQRRTPGTQYDTVHVLPTELRLEAAASPDGMRALHVFLAAYAGPRPLLLLSPWCADGHWSLLAIRHVAGQQPPEAVFCDSLGPTLSSHDRPLTTLEVARVHMDHLEAAADFCERFDPTTRIHVLLPSEPKLGAECGHYVLAWADHLVQHDWSQMTSLRLTRKHVLDYQRDVFGDWWTKAGQAQVDFRIETLALLRAVLGQLSQEVEARHMYKR
jgi:hypothetical protein